MSDLDENRPPAAEPSSGAGASKPRTEVGTQPATTGPTERRNARRWWIKLLLQPLIFLMLGVALLIGLGVAQRLGFLSSEDVSHRAVEPAGEAPVSYICPMLCTPPRSAPGRCPVCGMELVPTTSGSATTDRQSVEINPVARRVAHIQTAPVQSQVVARTLRAIGELRYNEGTMKTIAAYVDGRLDRLYADYTGVRVQHGDDLALLYSPQLYAGQVELLLAKNARDKRQSAPPNSVLIPNTSLYQVARDRLLLLGMTEPQIEQLEAAGEASSHLQLSAPMSGTVIEKLAVEGQYVKEGDAIYRLADLSTLWLILRLFPEDAAAVRYGQKVTAEVQSLPGQEFTGRVAFIDPRVDVETRTVGVRVVIPNPGELLRVGDYATATIEVPLAASAGNLIYDPDLANKWISPRHPHIVADNAGTCPVCGIDLVPAAEYGFSAEPLSGEEVLVVPRSAVLMAGNNSLVYVEAEPGRFEIRPVTLGPRLTDRIVIRSGVKPGEQVAVRGNFLIDSQMQLAGNPSLIDPARADSRIQPSDQEAEDATEIAAALSALSAEDRRLAEQQLSCPVSNERLGSMGTPPKVEVEGQSVFICCEGCRALLLADPQKYLARWAAKLETHPPHNPSHAPEEVDR